MCFASPIGGGDELHAGEDVKMKRKILLISLLLLLMGILEGSILPVGRVNGQEEPQLVWWAFGSAGGGSGVEDVFISASLGQPVSGLSEGGTVTLDAGYWYPGYGLSLVKIIFFQAVWQVEGVRVSWQTAYEIDLLGFNLYRGESEDGPWLQVNPQLIPSQYLEQSEGESYTWLDSDVTPGEGVFYMLEAVDENSQGFFTESVRAIHQMYLPLFQH
jgi:hypothetical protein